MKWDIFCRVVDNFGDIGVCWRLASHLVRLDQTVRLWVDDASALKWMASDRPSQVEVAQWVGGAMPQLAGTTGPGDVVIESFGCELPDWFVSQMKHTPAPTVAQRLWLNLEYLTAEDYASRCHGLPSPVMSGPGIGLVKYFYYPGFTRPTGGLLREPDLADRMRNFDAKTWLAQWRLTSYRHSLEPLKVSLFCYEPTALAQLIDLLKEVKRPVELLVTAGRSTNAIKSLENITFCNNYKHSLLSILYLPYLNQTDFDHLLWACDLNFVRGEDSLTRAIWAQKPFVWQLYPQEDGVHLQKMDAFLALGQPNAEERHWFNIWNGQSQGELHSLEALLSGQFPQRLFQRLQQQTDLASQILDFAFKKTR
ncbi:MAG: elongation factor P maturation arginine rhamnosyltransferase EarP [Betaproteobacteria bacterium]|jgi:uncharacterized repeat protein (TIGR03837 family)|nr:elongation factor P maturation arginine rhamnosyltransferase EarP [Betaproteobacteria bacterium]MBP7779948.1 elongation factor P maturation arginine rhamnosyltransferase EarP [Burkholderiaceae bacterium]